MLLLSLFRLVILLVTTISTVESSSLADLTDLRAFLISGAGDEYSEWMATCLSNVCTAPCFFCLF